ncbi:NUDIX hydrolase N-terminal domain-containing protein [Streptococcus merionis]|uniref:NUDIX hydrolase n=1 Tax=Streptococcus merionis TaxID=400065 RepID=UPI0026F2D9AD|nr:NUDIX hydrolase [Streptococcus merionis]
MSEIGVLKCLQNILALTNTGLVYAKDPFDQERYSQIRQETASLIAQISQLSSTELTDLLRPTKSYETPLVDVRAFILKEGKICLVQDKLAEGHWALPGGFAEVGLTPKENTAKEVLEETGFTVKVGKLLAIFDTNQDPNQIQAKQYYKLVFACEIESGHFEANTEVSDLHFFDLHHLPKLSTKRITENQIRECWRLVQSSD